MSQMTQKSFTPAGYNLLQPKETSYLPVCCRLFFSYQFTLFHCIKSPGARAQKQKKERNSACSESVFCCSFHLCSARIGESQGFNQLPCAIYWNMADILAGIAIYAEAAACVFLVKSCWSWRLVCSNFALIQSIFCSESVFLPIWAIACLHYCVVGAVYEFIICSCRFLFPT